MFSITRAFVFAAPLFALACTSSTSPPAEGQEDTATTSGNDQEALTEDKATTAMNGNATSGTDCRLLALVAHPVSLTQIDNPNLQQSAGKTDLAVFGGPSQPVRSGVAVATIVGAVSETELLGNHHLVFDDGVLRTRKDDINLTATADKCVMHADVTMNFYDGTGVFAGYSGSGFASGDLNFCGTPGHLTAFAKVCKAAK